jgi:hypothetical protein
VIKKTKHVLGDGKTRTYNLVFGFEA